MTSEQSKRAYHHGDLRNALIQAGQELLSEEGVSGLELRKVARRAGVSHAAPYRHFADRNALLAAIAEEGFHRMSVQIGACVEQAPDDPIVQLERAGYAYVAFARDNPALMREMFSGLTIDRKVDTSLYAASKAVFWQISEIMQRGQERGLLVEGEPKEQTFIMWSMIHGLAMLVVENQIPAEYSSAIDQTVGLFTRMLYSGLKRRAAPEEF